MLEIREATKVYRKNGQVIRAADGLSCTAGAGDLLVIHGPSGSGKSTLLLMAGGMLPPDGGAVLYEGADVYQWSSARRNRYRKHTVGFMFQRFYLLPYLTVFDNIRVPLALQGRSGQAGEAVGELADRLGFLTACPTNVGTGIRVSVMMHLPGLVWTKQIEKVFEAVRRMGLAVRGLYGEGTQASGDFFQLSNQRTLGLEEEEIIQGLRSVVPRIVEYERRARQSLLEQSRTQLDDRVSRALGMLRHARTIGSEETMLLLSAVRLGVNLGLVRDLSISRVNELFVLTQPAHLQKINRKILDREKRNAARAEFIRSRLDGK